MYEDGKETGRVEVDGAIVARKDVFGIGKGYWGGSFHGVIGEVKYYSKALTAQHIAEEFAEGVPQYQHRIL